MTTPQELRRDLVMGMCPEPEPGTSLLAAGFTRDGESSGGDWARVSRPVRAVQRLRLFEPPKMPDGPKNLWVRNLAPAAQRSPTREGADHA